ncbi:C-type lectin domain family 2 member B-like [Struthio camelus]|uniref:C-type lectin domain family 2 member B-like n=1 Tax=Struthio camelus TaxID=8801 RepID=UPI0036041175
MPPRVPGRVGPDGGGNASSVHLRLPFLTQEKARGPPRMLSQRPAEAGDAGYDDFSSLHSPGFGLKCIKDKKVPVGVTVVVAALLIAIIALAAKKCQPCPSCSSPVLPGCPEDGVGYGEKCFYFVEAEADWKSSESSCLSLGAHLGTIDSPKELRFLLRYGESLPYWIGLRREGSGPWKWPDGSFFTNSFEVRGEGQCAYLNAEGVDSDRCSRAKAAVCSRRPKPR